MNNGTVKKCVGLCVSMLCLISFGVAIFVFNIQVLLLYRFMLIAQATPQLNEIFDVV